MLKVSYVPNKDGLWSVRDENNQRIALFYDDGLAREMVEIFNAAQHTLAGGLALESAKKCALDFGGYACSCGMHESQAAKA